MIHQEDYGHGTVGEIVDGEGSEFVEFAETVWKPTLRNQAMSVQQAFQKVGRLPYETSRHILEFTDLPFQFQQANELIRLAPLLAAFHLREYCEWRNLPGFALEDIPGYWSFDDDEYDSDDVSD